MTKQFTPEEATRTLPYVKGIVTDILGTAKELRGLTEESEDPENDEEVELLQQDLLGLMEELEKLGASFRDWDFEIGLVDFPAQIDGEVWISTDHYRIENLFHNHFDRRRFVFQLQRMS